ncbi:hypothetical protein ACPC54_38895 [Kitasatospora sp. NPDC094028]
MFRLVLRPNPLTVAPQSVYDAKAERWTGEWPQLTKPPRAEPVGSARARSSTAAGSPTPRSCPA